MKITKEFAFELVSAMFYDWSFDFSIELFDDDRFYFQIGEKNNQLEVHTKMQEDENAIEISIYKQRSESSEVVGCYYLDDEEFERNSEFFEVMFSEHLVD